MDTYEKLNKMIEHINNMGTLAVAFRWVYSTFLLKVSADVLRDKVIAVTARSSTYPEREFRQAEALP
jgi:uncharacterized protein